MKRDLFRITILLFAFGALVYGTGPLQEPVQAQGRQPAYVRAGQPPKIPLGPQASPTATEVAKIKQMIADLAKIDSSDYGLSPTLTGTAFAPIAGSEHAGALLLTNHRIKRSEAFRQLVQLGPKALPFLLDALDDKTPTQLTIKHAGFFGTMSFAEEMDRNPANATEDRILAQAKVSFGSFDSIPSYTVKVGDVCFVIIGQIVGRSYEAVRYQPTACIMLNSPTQDPKIAKMVRAIWNSDQPAQHLLDSLLFDYTTVGIDEGKERVGSYIASKLQTEASMRLLYYFPQQSASMISDRLHRLQIQTIGPGSGSMHTNAQMKAWEKREKANGVDTKDFISAVSWCREPAIRTEMVRIFQSTMDPDILVASVRNLETSSHSLLIRNHLEAFLNQLSATEGGPFGDGYNILVALGKSVGKDAKPIFQNYMRNASLQRRRTMCHVLQETCGEWDIDLLGPLLKNKRPAEGWTYAVNPNQNEPRLPIRICDEAADTIRLHHPDMPFKMEGRHADLDRQIQAIQHKIAAQK